MGLRGACTVARSGDDAACENTLALIENVILCDEKRSPIEKIALNQAALWLPLELGSDSVWLR